MVCIPASVRDARSRPDRPHRRTIRCERASFSTSFRHPNRPFAQALRANDPIRFSAHGASARPGKNLDRHRLRSRIFRSGAFCSRMPRSGGRCANSVYRGLEQYFHAGWLKNTRHTRTDGRIVCPPNERRSEAERPHYTRCMSHASDGHSPGARVTPGDVLPLVTVVTR